MSHSELFRNDGTLHDLAIERRLAGTLGDELEAAFDQHIATHTRCRERFEAAQAHQQSWMAPPLPTMPNDASILDSPVRGNIAANRPLWSIAASAAAVAAAAAIGLLIGKDLNGEQLTATIHDLGPNDVDLMLQSDEGVATLTVQSPGHVAVVKVDSAGELTVLAPEQSDTSVAVETQVQFPLEPLDANEKLIAVKCQRPFTVERLFQSVDVQTSAALPTAPSGCIFVE